MSYCVDEINHTKANLFPLDVILEMALNKMSLMIIWTFKSKIMKSFNKNLTKSWNLENLNELNIFLY